MSGLAGIIHWAGPSVPRTDIQRMVELVRHRGPDRLCWQTVGNVGLGQATFHLHRRSDSSPQPLWLPQASGAQQAPYAIIADADIFNRTELLPQLSAVDWLAPHSSDAMLILAAYVRWREGLLDKLDGEFAFVIWDQAKQRVFAARDPFGVRPLFYRWDTARFVCGSEPKQILSLPGIPIAPDDMIVGEFLFDNFEDFERTFFQDIARLKPAHFLIATAQSAVQHRYWNPDPRAEIRYRSPHQYAEHFRQALCSAVAKRLSSDFPVGAQLSGGLDSSSIVMLAAALARQHRVSSPVEVVSAVFGALPCDESALIQAASQQLPFRSHRFCPLSESLSDGLMDDLWRLDAPAVDIERGLFQCCARLLSTLQARSVLTGVGGDELVHEAYYLRDLAHRKQWWTLLQEAWTASHTAWLSFPALLFDALKGEIPSSVKTLYRRLQKRRTSPPEWLNPDFLNFFSHCPEPPPLPSCGFPSLTQESAFQWLNFPAIGWYLEGLECRGAYQGFVHRHPFLDRPLAEFVLAIPFDQRLPDGQWKYLLRRGLASDLPAAILSPRQKTRFDAYHTAAFLHGKTQLSELLFDSGQWASARYISQDKIRKLFASANHLSSASAEQLWRIATVELWLRKLPRYQALQAGHAGHDRQ